MPKSYKDIPGWFPEQSATVLREIIQKYDVKTVTEIGVYLGKSVAFFSEQGCSVNAVDLFTMGKWSEISEQVIAQVTEEAGPDFYDKFMDNMSGVNVVPFRMSSEDASKLLGNTELIYIDAEHTYDQVLNDIKLWDSKASKIICGDDYEDLYPGVIKAVDEFYGDRVKVSGRVWYVIK